MVVVVVIAVVVVVVVLVLVVVVVVMVVVVGAWVVADEATKVCASGLLGSHFVVARHEDEGPTNL